MDLDLVQHYLSHGSYHTDYDPETVQKVREIAFDFKTKLKLKTCIIKITLYNEGCKVDQLTKTNRVTLMLTATVTDNLNQP